MGDISAWCISVTDWDILVQGVLVRLIEILVHGVLVWLAERY